MKKYFVAFILSVFVLIACKTKKKVQVKKFISVLSLIESQVAGVDTSLYSIIKIVQTDTLPGDTVFIAREEFRAAAKDFLSIPDLSDKKVAKRYKEETLFDETLNRVIITYTPNVITGDRVNNIIITRVISNKDSAMTQNMLWQMDKSFQVATTAQKPGKPEITTTVKVIWNEANDQ
jgi:hypothetical protein